MIDKEYQEWERQVEEAKKHNDELLFRFEKYLEKKSLSSKTIRNHVGNIEFYINHFLTYYEVIPVEKGFLKIGGFLCDFLIRKRTWASKYTVQ